ncbi:MAG: biotin--[acetyl-CoA-carboxylase] ligase [Methylococcaceae bacterium]|nr:biotin--[acetyl-CoA-carboxylase] ligase [Methylococcaceae bacterium]
MTLDALDKTLLGHLADGRFHSGTELSGLLGVSRAAVWKHIRGLERLGLTLSAIPGRGYRLLSPVDMLSAAAIRAGLTTEATALLGELDIHDALDSTNSHLLRAAPSGVVTGTVCLAEYQRAGRGRIGRDWFSPFGANIYLSLLWRFEDPTLVSGLSLAVGVAVVRALVKAGLPGIALKWPNDLLWGTAKLGGILLEVAGEAYGQCAVVIGLGLNRHLPESAATVIDQDWTDLSRTAHGEAPPRNALVATVLNELLPLLRDYPDQGLAHYLPEWRAAHAYAGRAATVRIGDRHVEGDIVDVTNEGLLLFRDQEGQLRQFASGDVRLRVKSS